MRVAFPWGRGVKAWLRQLYGWGFHHNNKKGGYGIRPYIIFIYHHFASNISASRLTESYRSFILSKAVSAVYPT